MEPGAARPCRARLTPTGWLSPTYRRELVGLRRIVTGRAYFPRTAAKEER